MEVSNTEPDKKRLKLEHVEVQKKSGETDIVSESVQTDSANTECSERAGLEADPPHHSGASLDELNTETLTATVVEESDSLKKIPADNDSTSDNAGDKVVVPVVRTEPLREIDVGITEYISKHEGFQGVIKQRYSDFLVSEIDLNDQVVQLTSFDLPVEKVIMKTNQDVSNIIGESDMEKLKSLVEKGDKSDTVMIQVDDDKDRRARIHGAIATGFTGLDSTTVTKDDKKYIEVKIAGNKAHKLKNWPKDRGDYCRFVLYKENKDTMDAISLISKQLRLKSSLFQYAGTKDRRAKTSQEVTAYRISAEKLLEVNKKLRNIATGNYRYVKKPLRLGDSKGNRFTMVLRSVTGSEAQIQSAMTSLQEVGFINYYGMQRFGTSSVPTHHIGRAVLHSNWKEAVELILKPRVGEDKEISDARTFWWETRDSKAALDKFPKQCHIERTILQGLITHGNNDCLGALRKVARNTQLIYIHSYQSYVWNTMVSRRIREFGLKPVVGDLVMPSDTATNCSGDASQEKVVPIVITAESLPNYSIEDIVLPLPGYNVIYPENDTKSWYQEKMEKDGLDIDNMRHKTKEYSLSGDYRSIVVRPTSVSWQTFRYDDVTVPLTLSDYDRLNKAAEPQSLEGGKQEALKVEFSLPSSCYATMAIRDVLKMDTSSAYQSSLNVT